MRYVLLLCALCMSFFLLNSVQKYQAPFSFFSTAKASGPAGSHDGNGHAQAHWITNPATVTKGGPSEGTGLHASAMVGEAGSSAIGTESAMSSEEAAAVAGEMAPAKTAEPASITKSTSALHTAAAPAIASLKAAEEMKHTTSLVATKAAASVKETASAADALGTVGSSEIVDNQSRTTNQVHINPNSNSTTTSTSGAGSVKTAARTSALTAVAQNVASTATANQDANLNNTPSSIVVAAAQNLVNAAKVSAIAPKTAVNTTGDDESNIGEVGVAQMSGSAEGPLASANADQSTAAYDISADFSMDADFLTPTPVADAVMVQPAYSAFEMSAASFAYAKWLRDSIQNSLMDPHGIQFGGIAGLNWAGAVSNTSGSGKVSGSTLTGFTLGAFADVPLTKSLHFRPSLLYADEGFQPNVQGSKVNIHVAFLSVPLDLVYHTKLFGKRFFVGAGPYLAYAMSGTYTIKGINTDMDFGNNYTNGDDLRHLDMGANVMAGLLMDRNFIIGAKFDMGLSNIAPTGSAADIRTRSFGISLGYVFRNRANTKTY